MIKSGRRYTEALCKTRYCQDCGWNLEVALVQVVVLDCCMNIFQILKILYESFYTSAPMNTLCVIVL